MPAKRKTDLETECDIRTENWVSVTRAEEPLQWEAWTNWRKANAGANAQPEGLTVPGPFPPTTMAAVNEYLETVGMLRTVNGWKRGRDRISKNPSAWMGEV